MVFGSTIGARQFDQPPSITCAWPVVNDDSSDARYSANAADLLGLADAAHRLTRDEGCLHGIQRRALRLGLRGDPLFELTGDETVPGQIALAAYTTRDEVGRNGLGQP